MVSNIHSRADGTHIKIISDATPEDYTYSRSTANLEDVYLDTFRETGILGSYNGSAFGMTDIKDEG